MLGACLATLSKEQGITVVAVCGAWEVVFNQKVIVIVRTAVIALITYSLFAVPPEELQSGHFQHEVHHATKRILSQMDQANVLENWPARHVLAANGGRQVICHALAIARLHKVSTCSTFGIVPFKCILSFADSTIPVLTPPRRCDSSRTIICWPSTLDCCCSPSSCAATGQWGPFH